MMRAAGPDNPLYRSSNEAVVELLGAAATQLEVLRELKLVGMLGKTPQQTKPRRAPFARSGLAATAMRGNIEAVIALFGSSSLPALLPPEALGLVNSLRFELEQARRVLGELEAAPRDWQSLLRDAGVQEKLRYITQPLGGAIGLLRRDYASALGLNLGFNAMDGD